MCLCVCVSHVLCVITHTGFGRGGPNWPLLRAAQLSALSVPHTGCVSAIDAASPSDINDIHPTNKSIISRRLTALLLNELYDVTPRLPTQGPTFSSAAAQYSARSAQLTVTVDFALGDAPDGSALVALGTPGCTACCTVQAVSRGSRPLFRFARQLNGSSTPLYAAPANMTVQGAQVVMTVASAPGMGWASGDVVTVQFEWSDFVECVLYNGQLLPAEPWQQEVVVAVVEQQSTGGGGAPVGTSTGSAAASTGTGPSPASGDADAELLVVVMEQAPSDGGVPASPNGGAGPSPSPGGGVTESSSESEASGALMGVIIVFCVLSAMCGVFWLHQYSMRRKRYVSVPLSVECE